LEKQSGDFSKEDCQESWRVTRKVLIPILFRLIHFI